MKATLGVASATRAAWARSAPPSAIVFVPSGYTSSAAEVDRAASGSPGAGGGASAGASSGIGGGPAANTRTAGDTIACAGAGGAATVRSRRPTGTMGEGWIFLAVLAGGWAWFSRFSAGGPDAAGRDSIAPGGVCHCAVELSG